MGERVLMKGNEAMAEAAIRAGCKFFFGYPITPQTEVSAYMARRMPKVGGLFLQAESEIAAINMVYGASSAGARVMTSSSSPGISLKSEGISYLCGADLPAVIANVQRGGPGLGGIQPSQSDYYQATRGLGHGDFHLIVYAPSTVQQMADYIFQAFEKADQYRTPVMLLSDGMIGQMMEPVDLPEREPVMFDKPWATTGTGMKRNGNITNSLYLVAQELEDTVVKRQERYEAIMRDEQQCETYLCDDADIVVVAFGAASRIVRSAVNMARERGIRVGMARPITLWPFPTDTMRQLCKTATTFLSVEMSMGQMIDDIRLSICDSKPVNFFGHTGGIIPEPDEVLACIEAINAGQSVHVVPFHGKITLDQLSKGGEAR